MQTVLITGGTGMIGSALTKHLISKGYKVIVVSRTKKASNNDITYAVWDVKKLYIDQNAIKAADHIIHLAGAGVGDKRWTRKRKKEIVDSRVQSGRLLIQSLREVPNKIRTIVCASGIGWYGEDKKPPRPFTEEAAPANDFLGNTSKQWQDSIEPAQHMNVRTVFLRTGIVLAKQGGAFPEFLKPIKAGVATIFGDGKQKVSWIHLDDVCRMYVAAIENTMMTGPFNAVAPHPVTNKELVLEIARARNRPFIPIHVPQFVLKLFLGELSIEILKSATASNAKIAATGFNYIYPTIESCVNALVR